MQIEKKRVAWQIAYEIMVRSIEPLSLTQLHPCSGQYNGLTIINKANNEPFAMINLNGDSIKLGDDSLLDPYVDMFKADKVKLFRSIARSGEITLNDQPVRRAAALEFLLEIIDLDIEIDSAWLDSSYESRLRIDANKFPTYPLNDKEDRLAHLPWWILSCSNIPIAMCNIESGELILQSTKKFNLNDIGEQHKAISYIQNLIDWQKTILQTKHELDKHSEWRARYEGYADEITGNIDIIKSIRRRFREWEPLKFYINVTNAKKAKSTVWLDIRFLGQKIGDLKCTAKEIKISTDNCESTNKRDFGCDISLSSVDWDSTKAREFRRYFRDLLRNGFTQNKGNEEHRIESLILSELSRKNDKILRNMAPVTINNVRFPMPTPLKASDHSTVTYAKQYGGGIDVFARAGTGGVNTTLCIMELKDENKPSEPPKDAIKQALVYTTFIRKLLLSQSGDKWWKLFGFNGAVPDKLVLNAVCVMPSNSNNDLTFKDQELNIGDDDIAKLQYIYFTEKENRVVDVIKSF